MLVICLMWCLEIGAWSVFLVHVNISTVTQRCRAESSPSVDLNSMPTHCKKASLIRNFSNRWQHRFLSYDDSARVWPWRKLTTSLETGDWKFGSMACLHLEDHNNIRNHTSIWEQLDWKSKRSEIKAAMCRAQRGWMIQRIGYPVVWFHFARKLKLT